MTRLFRILSSFASRRLALPAMKAAHCRSIQLQHAMLSRTRSAAAARKTISGFSTAASTAMGSPLMRESNVA